MGNGSGVIVVDTETTNPCAEISLGGFMHAVTFTVPNIQMWTIMNVKLDPLQDHWYDMPGDNLAQCYLKAMRGLKLLHQDDIKESCDLIYGFTHRYNQKKRINVTAVMKEQKRRREKPYHDRRAQCNPSMKGRSYNGR